MENIYDFIAIFKTYLNQKSKNIFWIDPKHTRYGTLLIKNLISNKKIIFKPIDLTLPIGGKRIHDFIINTPTFKKNSIDNYIFVARKYKECAIKLTESNKQLTLLTVDFENKNIKLDGSKNIDMDILKFIKAFSNHFDDIAKNTVSNQNEKIEVKTTEHDYWSDYNKKYPSFKYVMIIALIILFFYIIGKFSTPDPEYNKFIDTRAKMMMLKEKGLVTDKDIKQYEDAYYESRRNKKK